jgi:hypothetical protein
VTSEHTPFIRNESLIDDNCSNDLGCRLAGLSESPSEKTNARAAAILRQLGVREDKVQDVLGRSVNSHP